MKKAIIISVLFFGIVNLSYSQTIKPLSNFYTDTFPKAEDVFIPVYYKDIDNNFIPFLGQWKYVNGNTTFIVSLWKKTKLPIYHKEFLHYYVDNIFGHYQMFTDYGLTTQQLLYTSQTNIGTTNQMWETVIISKVGIANKLTGTINDIMGTPVNNNYPEGTTGYLSMTINPGTSPVTAQWFVSNSGSLYNINQPKNFTIPTNVTLTKI